MTPACDFSHRLPILRCALTRFVYKGHGVGQLPSFYCDELLAKGRLVRLLPQWPSPPIRLLQSSPGPVCAPAPVK